MRYLCLTSIFLITSIGSWCALPPGSVDPGFIPPALNGDVHSIAVQVDGRILVGGDFTQAGGAPRIGLVRLNADGKLDVTFRSELVSGGRSNIVSALALQKDGKVLVGFSSQSGAETNAMVQRLNSDGTLDQAFRLPLRPFFLGPTFISSIFPQADAKMLVAGRYLADVPGGLPQVLMRLNEDGSIDRTFAHDLSYFPLGVWSYQYQIDSLDVQPNSKLLLGGIFISSNNVCVARVNPTGGTDPTFRAALSTSLNDPTGFGRVAPSVTALAAVGEKVVVAGLFDHINGVPRHRMARLDSDGKVDLSFDAGIAINAAVNTMRDDLGRRISKLLLLPGERLFVGGNFTTFNRIARGYFVRLLPDGTVDPAFSLGGGASGPVHAAVLQRDGKLLIGGAFAAVDGQARSGLARLILDDLTARPPVILQSPQNQSVPEGENVRLSVVADGPELKYQWRFNGTDVPGATNAVLSLTNLAKHQEGLYAAVVSNPYGTTVSADARLIVLDLASAVNFPASRWTTSGANMTGWFAQTNVVHDSSAAAESGLDLNEIPIDRESWLDTTSTGPGRLSFWWKMQDASGQHFGTKSKLQFLLNGWEQASISEAADWHQKQFNLPAGIHDLRWTFLPRNERGKDRAWLDQVTFEPLAKAPELRLSAMPPTPTKGFHLILTGAAGAHYGFEASTKLAGAWSLLTNFVSADDQIIFFDPDANRYQHRFYGVTELPAPLSLAASLNVPEWKFITGGTGTGLPWSSQTTVTHDGTAAAQSGTFTGGGALFTRTSWFESTLTGPGTLTFWHKVSLGDLRLTVNGTERFREFNENTTQSVWRQASILIPEGQQAVRWTFFFVSFLGLGSAWVDQIQYTPTVR